MDVVEWCLAHGSDVNVANSQRWVALDWAAASSTAEVIRLLVSHGGDLSRSSALHAAAAVEPEDDIDPAARRALIACLIHEYNVEVNALSRWEDGAPRGGKNVSGTALHRAIQAGNRSTVEALLENGADRCAVNALGLSCVAYAAEYGSDEIRELLELPNRART